MNTLKKITPYWIKSTIKKIYLSAKYLRDFLLFQKISGSAPRFSMLWKDRKPQLYDNTKATPFDGHYTYHPAWAARIIAKESPTKHIDIASILTFSTMLSAFIPVEFYDYRPAKITLDDLKTEHADLLSLPFESGSIESLSCLHTLEHVGLGRYGDPLDPNGDIRAINELIRVLAPGGNLLIAVPMGAPKIEFNAHRVYSYEQITNYFKDLTLQDFSLIPDNALDIGMISPATKDQADTQRYGCGCFWFKKKYA